MNESWGVIQQNFNIPDTSWNESTVDRSQMENWERPGNWGADRPSAPAPSENNLSAKKTIQDSWGQNKSENSWNLRNETVQVDQSTWQSRKEQPAISTSEYKVKRENEEEKLDVGIQQSFETLRNDDRHLVLDEDDYDQSYENFSTSSKPQLGKSIATPFEEEIPFNSDDYNAKGHVGPFITSHSTFQELPKKEFRNVEVQTDPIDISRIIASKEKLLSCTIGSPMKKEYQQTGQDPFNSATNNVPDKRYPPQQMSLLDVDPDELNTKVNWKTSSSDRESKSDNNSRGEVTQWPKPNSDSWDNKPISVQNDSWNRTSTRNDNRGTVPQQIPVTPDSWDASNDNRGPIPQQIPVTPDSWDAPPQTSAPQTSTRNDNRGPIPQQIPVTPDSWDAPPQTSTLQTSTRNDNRGPIPQQIPVTPDSWDARNDNRGPIPQQIPVKPDSWDAPPQTSTSQTSASQTSTRNDNRGPIPQQIPVTPDSWDAPPQTSTSQTSTSQTSTRNDSRGPVSQPIPVTADSWDARNDNRRPIPQQISVTPDSWDARNDNRGPVPQQIPVTPDSWDAQPQTSVNNVNRDPVPQSIPRNDNRSTIPQIPVEPDNWDSAPQTSAKNNQGSNWNPVPQPIQNNSWDQQQSQPKDTRTQEGPSENWKATSIQQGPQNDQNRELSNTNNQWGLNRTADSTNDWTKTAEMFAKELRESSESKVWEQTSNAGQKAEDSYGTGASDSYYDNSSSNNRCHNCGQEGHFIRDCPDKKQGYNSGRSCHKCGKEGHIARDCTEENSKGGFGGGYGGGYGGGREYGGKSCHKCGKEGHIARDCTEESGRSGYGGGRSCHKCGKEGHFARDCTEESGRSGYGGGKSCHKCGKEGHLARDCREDAYETTGEDNSYGGRNTCYKCKRPGHRASECTEEPEMSREFNYSGQPRPHTKTSPFSNSELPNISSKEAWEKLLTAGNEEDVDDFAEALEIYAKTAPDETFVSIEKKLRTANCKGRIIALERSEIPLTKVLVDLQGNTNKKYVARPIMVHPSRLARTSGNRASNEEENLQWLANAGFMVDDHSPICFNCKQKGHLSKDCSEPKREIEKHSYLTCQNCNSPDHLTKFCKEERRDYYVEARDRKVAGGYKGGSMEHEDRAASGFDGEDDRRSYRGYNSSNSEPRRGGRRCNKCGEEGHISRDCINSGGGDYDRGNYNSSSGWQRDSSSRNNDKNASWSTQDKGGDNTWNKSRNENTNVPALSPRENSRNNPSGGDSSRGDYNNAQHRSENDTYGNNNRNSSLPTQNKDRDTSRQRDNQTVLIPKVESDSWDAQPKIANTAEGKEWGYKTAEDFGWGKSSENKTSASVDYEDRRSRGNEQRERTPAHDDYEDRRGRGNDRRERSSTYNDHENRRIRGNDQRERTSAHDDYDNRRGRGNGQRERSSTYDDYDNRRSRGNDQRERSSAHDDYDNRRGRGNDQGERSSAYDDWRGRGNDQRERTNNNRFTNSSSRMQSNDTNNKNSGLVESSWW